MLKQNKSHGLGVTHLKEIIKTNHVLLVFSQCVLKAGDSGHFFN